jgi:hypothetical protein
MFVSVKFDGGVAIAWTCFNNTGMEGTHPMVVK